MGTVRLFVDDVPAGSAEGVPTAPRGYSMVQEGLSIGRAWGPPVSGVHYHGAFEFTGNLHVVEMRTDPTRQVAPTNAG